MGCKHCQFWRHMYTWGKKKNSNSIPMKPWTSRIRNEWWPLHRDVYNRFSYQYRQPWHSSRCSWMTGGGSDLSSQGSRHGDVSPCFTQPHASAALNKVTPSDRQTGTQQPVKSDDTRAVSRGSNRFKPNLTSKLIIHCNLMNPWFQFASWGKTGSQLKTDWLTDWLE